MPFGHASMEAKKTSQKSFFKLALIPNLSSLMGESPGTQEAQVTEKKTVRHHFEPCSGLWRKLIYGKAADYKEWL